MLFAVALTTALALHASPRLLSPRAYAACARSTVCVAQATEAQDALIAKLRAAPLDGLTAIVANDMKAIDQRFFLRLAELADAADDEADRDSIAELASSVASSVETLLRLADEKIQDDGSKAQAILQIAASESGEFEVPIPAERAAAVRAAIRERGGSLDDGFVATIKAYMSKADKDGMEGLVEMLREVLQLFAAERLLALVEPRLEDGSGLAAALRAVLAAKPDEWEETLRGQVATAEPVCGPLELQSALQDQMGEVVLGMPSGSALQALLAEYLNELLERTRVIVAELA